MSTYITPLELGDSLTLRDLSDPAQGTHAMQTILADVIADLAGSWQISSTTLRHSPLVPVEDNYDRLGFDPNAVTRDRRYSRYISPTVMLRSHTSASVPWVLSSLTGQADIDQLFVMPGLVYRRDAIDRTHVGAPHQVDLWRISSHPGLAESDLEEMIATIVNAVLPETIWRAVPAIHPYTTAGRQIDVLVNDEWLELAECGLIAPHLFNRAGIDPAQWSGLALGMGLDRAMMLRKGLDDIRLLRSQDPRIASQMLDLAPWAPVSVMPLIRRDISVVIDENADEETLGDSVRTALGNRIDDLESVEVLNITSYKALPVRARERLALNPQQVNALIRITLRPLSTTLTDREANEIRNSVYLALHEGSVLELIE